MSSLFTNRIIALVALFALAACAVHAQDIEGGAASSRKDLGGGAGSSSVGGGARVGGGVGGGGGGGGTSNRRDRLRTTATQAAPKTKTIILTPTTGTLSVATESRATIYVEPAGGGTPIKGEVDPGERIFIFNKLKPGRYDVYAELDGYTDVEKTITVEANKNASVTLDIKPLTYTVTFVTNVNDGNIRYAPAELRGSEYVVTGKTIYVPITSTRTVLTDLRPGLYVADVLAKDPGYQQERTSFTITDNSSFEINLKKLESTKTFAASWVSLTSWDAPTTWRTESRKLIVAGPGLALPKDESYRYYKDFEISSDVKMVNGVAATFILRAQDARNYYLIQITGARADEPYVLRAFLVRNGTAQRLSSPVPIDVFSNTLAAGQFFHINLKMVDNNVTVSITDSQTGQNLPLGIITDPNRTFRIGAVGIGARDTEQNEVGGFAICTPECPKG